MESEALSYKTALAPALPRRYSMDWEVGVVIVAGVGAACRDAVKTRIIGGGDEKMVSARLAS